jgi:hypothetical protein
LKVNLGFGGTSPSSLGSKNEPKKKPGNIFRNSVDFQRTTECFRS